MENSLLKKHRSVSGIEVALIAVSALIVGVLLTAVFTAYQNLNDVSVVEVSAQNSVIN